MKRLIFGSAAIGVLVLSSLAVLGSRARAADGPCGTSHDAVDAEEAQFLGLLQGWRDSHVSPSTPLQQSGALNAAAAWFAEYQVTTGGFGGHSDSYGRSWVDRARNCGYDPYYAQGSGEGIYAISSSGPVNVGPAQAIVGITYPGSGVYIQTPSVSLPAKCVGVAVRRNASGTAVAWVAIIAQFPSTQPCPASTATSPPGNPSPSPSPTKTPTPTFTPSPSPTPTRTPTSPTGLPRRAVVPLVARDFSP